MRKREMKSIRVVTWNVLDRNRMVRLPVLSHALSQVDADVVLLQETDKEHAAALAAALGLQLAGVGPDFANGVTSVPAVLTRVAPTACSVHPLTRGVRDYFFVEAVVPIGGIPIRFGSAHLQHTHLAGRMGIDRDYRAVALGGADIDSISDASLRESVIIRMAQVADIHRIRAVAEDGPEIIGGDLNFVPRGLEYQAMLRVGDRLALADAWMAGPRLGSGATVVERNPLIADGLAAYESRVVDRFLGATGQLDYTLDFQLCSSELEVGDAWIVGDPLDGAKDWPSDHLGLVVEYSLHAE
jgi:endonuclease/exonuclease/phosphatase family metal-dependent hydrolase